MPYAMLRSMPIMFVLALAALFAAPPLYTTHHSLSWTAPTEPDAVLVLRVSSVTNGAATGTNVVTLGLRTPPLGLTNILANVPPSLVPLRLWSAIVLTNTGLTSDWIEAKDSDGNALTNGFVWDGRTVRPVEVRVVGP